MFHNVFFFAWGLGRRGVLKLPLGFRYGTLGKVCRLHKSLYGLKQAPRYWFSKFVGALKHYGFTQFTFDHSLFTLQRKNVQLHVLFYMNDLVIFGNDDVAIKTFKTYLRAYFHMKDLGLLKYFLGIELARISIGIFLCQHKYVLDIIFEAGLLGANLVGSPMDPRLSLAKGVLLPDLEQYQGW